MTVTFCGHRDTYLSEFLNKKFDKILIDLIENGADKFLFGGYGRFDIIAAEKVYNLKKIYPHIHSVLVIPYLNRKNFCIYYDCTEYPPIENVPLRFAISKRNEWMIQQANTVIAYVNLTFGGAAKTLDYARRKEKNIINLADFLKQQHD